MAVAIECLGCGKVVSPPDLPPPGWPDDPQPQPNPFRGWRFPAELPEGLGLCPSCKPRHVAGVA